MASKKADVPDPEPAPQVWALTIEGKTFPFFYLPIDELDEIAKRHEVSWMRIVDRPLDDLQICRDLVLVAAKKLGVAMPMLPSAKSLYDIVNLIPEDLPGVYTDGIPKSPSTADNPATTG